MEVGEAVPQILTLSLLFILITSVEAVVFLLSWGFPLPVLSMWFLVLKQAVSSPLQFRCNSSSCYRSGLEWTSVILCVCEHVFRGCPADALLLKSDFMETAQTSGVWLASCLDAGQNELIHDSASSCLVVGVLFFLDLLTRQRRREVVRLWHGSQRLRQGLTTGSLPPPRRLLSSAASGLHCSLRRGPVCSGHTPALSGWGQGQVSSQGWSCSPCVRMYVRCVWSHDD